MSNSGTSVKIIVAVLICAIISVTLLFTVILFNMVVNFDPASPPGSAQSVSLTLSQVRKSHTTILSRNHRDRTRLDSPPSDSIYKRINYPAPRGEFPAYLAISDPQNRHPALIWIDGGDCNTIGDVWRSPHPTNALIKQQIVVMFPSLRGGNNNLGSQESMFGEVDDIIAARNYLASLPQVDPARIYLAGHSTGGTLVLLTSECTGKFRAVFSFGPMARVADYGSDGNFVLFNPNSQPEADLRAPIKWLHCITSPTFVIEGDRAQRGNAPALREMSAVNNNPNVKFLIVPTHDHFSITTPAARVIADKITADTGITCNIKIDENAL
jgi:dipeptidyl aminopeptidase/acylaminoacyl peptidase